MPKIKAIKKFKVGAQFSKPLPTTSFAMAAAPSACPDPAATSTACTAVPPPTNPVATTAVVPESSPEEEALPIAPPASNTESPVQVLQETEVDVLPMVEEEEEDDDNDAARVPKIFNLTEGGQFLIAIFSLFQEKLWCGRVCPHLKSLKQYMNLHCIKFSVK